MTLFVWLCLCINANALSFNRIVSIRLQPLTAENAITRINGDWTPHYVLGQEKIKELSEFKQPEIAMEAMERADEDVRSANLIKKENEDKTIDRALSLWEREIELEKQEDITKNTAKERAHEKVELSDLISMDFFLPKKMRKKKEDKVDNIASVFSNREVTIEEIIMDLANETVDGNVRIVAPIQRESEVKEINGVSDLMEKENEDEGRDRASILLEKETNSDIILEAKDANAEVRIKRASILLEKEIEDEKILEVKNANTEARISKEFKKVIERTRVAGIVDKWKRMKRWIGNVRKSNEFTENEELKMDKAVVNYDDLLIHKMRGVTLDAMREVKKRFSNQIGTLLKFVFSLFTKSSVKYSFLVICIVLS